MHKVFPPPLDPYAGLAASAITSNVIPGAHAVSLTLSCWTSAGTASPVTVQVTNSGQTQGEIAAASWSNWTAFTPSGAAFVHLPVGARWYRLLRDPSLASTHFAVQRVEE